MSDGYPSDPPAESVAYQWPLTALHSLSFGAFEAEAYGGERCGR
jgi:hypothetical protein